MITLYSQYPLINSISNYTRLELWVLDQGSGNSETEKYSRVRIWEKAEVSQTSNSNLRRL